MKANIELTVDEYLRLHGIDDFSPGKTISDFPINDYDYAKNNLKPKHKLRGIHTLEIFTFVQVAEQLRQLKNQKKVGEYNMAQGIELIGMGQRVLTDLDVACVIDTRFVLFECKSFLDIESTVGLSEEEIKRISEEAEHELSIILSQISTLQKSAELSLDYFRPILVTLQEQNVISRFKGLNELLDEAREYLGLEVLRRNDMVTRINPQILGSKFQEMLEKWDWV